MLNFLSPFFFLVFGIIPAQKLLYSLIFVIKKSMSREELINKATEFLSDPRIIKAPEDKKRSYLKSKGLTDEEINIAMQRAGKDN